MASFLFLFLFLSIFLPTPIASPSNLHPNSRRNLHSITIKDEALHFPIPKSKLPSSKNKPIPESIQIKNPNSTKSKPLPPKNKVIPESIQIKNPNFTKSAKPNKANSTLSSSSPITKSKLNKTISPIIKPKLNKTISPIINPKPNKTSIVPKPSNSTRSPNLKIQKNPVVKPKDPTSGKPPKPKAAQENWIEDTEFSGEYDDLIPEFRDLPSLLHSALVPDLHKLSLTSKIYLSRTHREIAAGVKPFVGKKYASSIASAASAALVVLPLLLVTSLFRHLIRTGSTASLYRALLFVQAYLAIYFATLSLTALVTGLEPLRFFYAASPGAYAWTQAVQTFGYVVYLVAQMVALAVAFSAGEGKRPVGKAVGLAQMLLGLAVGMHYYITVFHRAVTGDAPRANWKVHGIYAACFVVICGLGRADRRKKAYAQGGSGEYCKNS